MSLDDDSLPPLGNSTSSSSSSIGFSASIVPTTANANAAAALDESLDVTTTTAAGGGVPSQSPSYPYDSYVKLISAEGHEFIIERSCALCSATLHTLLDGAGAGVWRETHPDQGDFPCVQFDTIGTPILEKVCQYFYYKQRYNHTTPPLPPFKINVKHVEKLLEAAAYLDT